MKDNVNTHAPAGLAGAPLTLARMAAAGCTTESLRIASEAVADFATIDLVLKEQLGLKSGPFETMDRVGLDGVQAEMEALYRQNYEEPRYRPSPLTAERVSAGRLGQKSGEGFYRYVDGQPVLPPSQPLPQIDELPPVWVSTRASRRAELYQLLKDLGARIETGQSPSGQALTLVAPLGFDITTVAVVERLDPARTIGIDMLIEDAATKRRVLATNPATRSDMRDAAHALFARDGKAVTVIRDSAGFISQRVVAMLANVASEMCQQRLCSPKQLDDAVTSQLAYPMGPLAMADRWGPTNVLEVLFNMQTVYGDTRYRPSPWLRRRGAIGLSLLQEEN